ncbi:uncharacterized protein LOC144449552 [Glandiceps talaboti]
MDEIVGLNVGGRIFITSSSYLTRYSDSILAAMFDCEHLGTRKNGRKTDEYGNVVIDRSGELFRYIFYYLRTSILLLPDGFQEKELDLLMDEAQFYHLPELEEAITRRKLLRNGKTLALGSANTKAGHIQTCHCTGKNKRKNVIEGNFFSETTTNPTGSTKQCSLFWDQTKDEREVRPLSSVSLVQNKTQKKLAKTVKGNGLMHDYGAHLSRLSNQSVGCISKEPDDCKQFVTSEQPDGRIAKDGTTTSHIQESSIPRVHVAGCEKRTGDLHHTRLSVHESTSETTVAERLKDSNKTNKNKTTTPSCSTQDSKQTTENSTVNSKSKTSVEPEYPQLQWFEYVYLE